jgi:hypothetical protein
MRAINNFSVGDRRRIAETRDLMSGDEFANNPHGVLRGGRNIGGPLPSMGWDSFFGALQRTGDEAQDAGMKFNVDLVGKRGTSGIGTLKGLDLNADAGQAIPYALRGLTRAAGRR